MLSLSDPLKANVIKLGVSFVRKSGAVERRIWQQWQRANLPLAWVLAVLLVLPLTIAVATVTYLLSQAGQQAIDKLSDRLLQEVAQRIREQLQQELTPPQDIVRELQQSFANGEIDAQASQQVHQALWQRLNLFPTVATLTMVWERGDSVSYRRDRTGQLFGKDSLVLTQRPPGPNQDRTSYRLNRLGQPEKVVARMRVDARDQPWYQRARRIGQQHWSAVFSFQDFPMLSLASLAPVIDAQGRALGVIAASLSLSSLDDFLDRLQISPGGQAFIFNDAGKLLASSTDEVLFWPQVKGRPKLVLAVDSEDPLTRRAARLILERLGSFQPPARTQKLIWDDPTTGERILAQVSPYRVGKSLVKHDGLGLNWSVVVVVPETDFTAEVQLSQRKTLALALGALAVSLGAGLAVSRLILRPLQQLNATAQHLASGQFDRPIDRSALRELNQLGESFTQMCRQLQRSFTEMRSLNQELQDGEARLASFLNALPICVVIYNLDGEAVYFNRRAADVLDSDQMPGILLPNQAADATYTAYLAGTDVPYPGAWLPLPRALAGEVVEIDDLEIRSEERAIDLELWASPIFDCTGAITDAIVAFHDITPRKNAEIILSDYQKQLERQVKERTIALEIEIQEHQKTEIALRQAETRLRRLNSELAELANTDALTRVANRRQFDTHLKREWERLAREQSCLGLILFDIDYFKRYNDCYGHPAGDSCLVAVAKAAQGVLRQPPDLLARYGGEEFGVILSQTDEDQALAVGERLRAAVLGLALPHARSDTGPWVSISVGVAVLWPQAHRSPDLLITMADHALYAAKHQGRDRVVLRQAVATP